MNELISKFKDEMAEFSKTCKAYYRGEMSVAEYKSKSGGFGTYSERGHKTGMMRLRIPAGDLTNRQFAFVLEQIKKYDIKKIHFTTNQSIQFHNINAKAICEIMLEALDYGIITRGGGGDFPRNAMCSPLSGVQKDEFFDVMPYAKAVSNYVLEFIGAVALPRKIKISFSNSRENIVHSTFRDMGFVAREDGKFDLYTAGGLGPNPALGIKTAQAIEPSKVLYYVRTMVQLFSKYGNFESRPKARTRYIPQTMGKEQYLFEFNRILDENLRDNGLLINPEGLKINKKGDGTIPQNDRNVTEQKQQGLYSVKYHPLSGNPNPETLQKIYDAITKMDDVSLRLSTKEEAYIINLTGKEADLIMGIIQNENAKTKLQESVTCVGATLCQVGIADSRGLLQKIIEAEKEENFSDGSLPSICISGCPSSCSAHQTAILGFQGTKKKVGNELLSAYHMYVGGSELQNKEEFGKLIGIIPEKDVPEMFRQLGRAAESSNLDFEKWYNSNTEQFSQIVSKYLI